MGLDYSFNLFFEHQDPWMVLDGLAEWAEPSLDKVTPILYPDQILNFPFEAWAGTEEKLPIPYDDPRPEFDFMTVLLFEPDDELRDYQESYAHGKKVPQNHIGVGYIYMTLFPDSSQYSEDYDPGLMMIRLEAATSNMSILFCESLSMRKRFTDLLERYHGVYGLIDREDAGTLFWLRGARLDIEIPDASMPLGAIEDYLRDIL